MAEPGSGFTLIARQMRVRPLAFALVMAITLLTLVLAAVVPRLVERQSTTELTSQLESIGAVSRSLQAYGTFPENWIPDPPPSAELLYGDIATSVARARQNLRPPLSRLVASPKWIVQASAIQGIPQNGAIPLLGFQLTADPEYLSRIQIVDGAAPATWSATDLDAPDDTRTIPVEVVVSTDAARSLDIRVGDLVGANISEGVPDRLYRVSGLFKPTDPSDEYWQQNPSLLPASTARGLYGVVFPSVSAFVAPLTVGHLSKQFQTAQLFVYFPIRTTGVDGADVGVLKTELNAAESTGISLANNGAPLPLQTGTQQAVQTAENRVTLQSGLLALIAAAPLGLVFAVLTLGVQALVRARRSEMVLAAARGGSEWQLRGAMALECAIVSIPLGILVTTLAALLIPGKTPAGALALAPITAVLPPLLIAALTVTSQRTRPFVRLIGQLRSVGEIALIGLATLAVFSLGRRGLAETSAQIGVDPLLSVAPLLLAASAGIIVIRVYPLPMHAARRLAVESRGLRAFIGAIRATRSPTIGLSGVLALVVGISVALFSTVLLNTFESSLHSAARETVGADARVDASALSPTQRRDVATVRGVRQVAGISYLSNQTVSDGPVSSVSVILAETTPLATMRTLPKNLTTPLSGRVPVVVSSDLFTTLGGVRDLTVQGVLVHVVGRLPASSGFGVVNNWMMADSAFSTNFATPFVPETLLISADPALLSRLIGPLRAALKLKADGKESPSSLAVSTVPEVIAERQSEPVIVGVYTGLISAALMSALLCALALILATVAAAAARARTAGILRTLGMRRNGIAVITAWELVPVALVALTAGTVLGIALPFIVTTAVDLRPFTGSLERPSPTLEPALLALVLGAFAGTVITAGIAAVVAGDRLHPSKALKMGN